MMMEMIVCGFFHQGHGQEAAFGPPRHVAGQVLWEFSASIGDRVHHKDSLPIHITHADQSSSCCNGENAFGDCLVVLRVRSGSTHWLEYQRYENPSKGNEVL